jgi:23S rRNA pseudouridine1911/1915/1917 synthase
VTLLEMVLRQFPGTPRTRAKQWIAHGRVRVGGGVVRQANAPVAADAKIELGHRREQALTGARNWRLHGKVGLLYLDRSVAVVDKAAGLLAVPAPGQGMSALSILGGWLAGEEAPAPFRRLRPQPVHRLDQYTSGVLCFAMNPVARAHLIEQFSQHRAMRTYLAYVEGRPATPRGTWRHLLRFDEEKLRQRVVGGAGEQPRRAGTVEAVTHFEVVEEFGAVTKLRLRLETGRTHQIRAQAAAAGLPLVGDRRYHPGRGGPWLERQALHAESLELEHPDTHKRMTWRAPLPADLRALEQKLRRGFGGGGGSGPAGRGSVRNR